MSNMVLNTPLTLSFIIFIIIVFIIIILRLIKIVFGSEKRLCSVLLSTILMISIFFILYQHLQEDKTYDTIKKQKKKEKLKE